MIANETYQKIAFDLRKKYDELKYCPVESILFLENTESAAKNKNKLKYAEISKIPNKWQDILKQVTNRYFGYIIEIFKPNVEEFTWSQMVLIIYRELRKINAEGELNAYQIEEWGEVVYSVGYDWDGKNRIIPNLLDADGNWDAMKQPRLFEDDLPGIRRVK